MMIMRSKFGSIETIVFQSMRTIRGFNKNWHQFWSFYMNNSEQNGTGGILFSKEAMFLS